MWQCRGRIDRSLQHFTNFYYVFRVSGLGIRASIIIPNTTLLKVTKKVHKIYDYGTKSPNTGIGMVLWDLIP